MAAMAYYSQFGEGASRKQVQQAFLQILKHQPAALNGDDDSSERGEQHHIRGFNGNVAAAYTRCESAQSSKTI